ncbi:hypothetical protein [Bergeyella zoohelcum]|uniref:Uncharacterized protein n=1 Tax=Bergeyella zoohelcum ATCC 43767 TaxID=883096 RepID=K1MAH4_9FLAO|nr:hypothetical protein [Bergeyella zoohelcum]EKB59368.1 hypothetical protein HMPREF9699_00304 [Bergeyella zoohelcum ATCC 43767]SUV49520.1 Uncharacterised protein [Bergeyella zoohelcum]
MRYIGVLLILLLIGCRTEEQWLEETQRSQYFRTLGETHKEGFPYGSKFRDLFQRRDSIQHTKNKKFTPLVLGKDAKLRQNTPYIEWNIYTEPMMGNGEVWVLYPLVEHGRVRDIFGVTLSEDRTVLGSYIISPQTEYHDEFKEKMNVALEQLGKPKTEQLSYNRGMVAKVRCTGEDVCDIEEVVISAPPRSPRYYFFTSYYDYGSDSGGCGDFNDCSYSGNIGGGGGGGDPKPKDHQDPCNKIKQQRNSIDFNKSIEKLKNNTGLSKETGYIQRNEGEYVYYDDSHASNGSQAHSLGLPNPRIEDYKDIYGVMHTHIDSDSGVKMFSPADVDYFMDMVRNAAEKGRALSDVYMIMISSSGNYQLRFTGREEDIKTFTETEMKKISKEYAQMFEKSEYDITYAPNLELPFLQFLQNKMSLKGVSLYKMDRKDKNKEIKLNDRGTWIKTTEC